MEDDTAEITRHQQAVNHHELLPQSSLPTVEEGDPAEQEAMKALLVTAPQVSLWW